MRVFLQGTVWKWVVNTFDGGVCDFRHFGRVGSGKRTKEFVDETSGSWWGDEVTFGESKAGLKGLERQDVVEYAIVFMTTWKEKVKSQEL
jgi:hypothetical protein